ncbi:MAG: glycosyltransferase [Desulfobacterales bacterium]|nr:glycosyltransferase [Desulfobacterales bacterium]
MERLEGGLRSQGLYKGPLSLREIRDTNKTFELAGCLNKNKEFPLISVITVLYNGEKYLEQTIQSVLSQTYPNIEYIIIDGGSTDDSLGIIQKYSDKIDYFVSENDNGIYHAMNKGIQLSNGELIGIINCDDWYSEIAVELVVKKYLALEERDNVIISGGLRCINARGKVGYEIIREESDIDKYIKKTMPINHPATFVSAQTYQTVGMFDERFIISADYNFVCQAYYSSIVKFYFCKDILTNMRFGGLSTETRNIFLIAKENYLVRKEYISMIENLYYMARSLLINLLKATFAKFRK